MKTRSITIEGSNPPLDLSITNDTNENEVVLGFESPMTGVEFRGLSGFQLMEIGRFILDAGIERDNVDAHRTLGEAR